MSRNRKILKNTAYLYVRLLINVVISLYTVRIILNALGVDDFGIYNVVGGIVALFAFFPGTMASATQRYFSFALGANDQKKLKTTFTVNWVLYSIIALLALIFLESIGLWYVRHELNVPLDRRDAVLNLYHFSVMAFVLSVFSAPFMAILIAHENMKIYAMVSIADALLKLMAAYALSFTMWDKLPFYGFLLLLTSSVILTIYVVICFKKYEECQLKIFYWDKLLLKEIMSFTGWTLFGQLTTVIRTHAITILLNQMFNPAVVAARAIAVMVGGQVNMFSQNFNVSLYPPIIKSYAAQQMEEMYALIFNGSKVTFFLMWIIALPLFLEMEAVLNIWLENPPQDTLLFARLALIEAMIFAISMPLTTAARAPGKMRFYELTLGIMQLAILPLSWGVLKLGYEAWSVFVVAIAVNVIMFFARLFIVRMLIGISVTGFFRRVVIPAILTMFFSVMLTIGINKIFPDNFWFTALTVIWSILVTVLSIYVFGLDQALRQKLHQKIAAKISNGVM